MNKFRSALGFLALLAGIGATAARAQSAPPAAPAGIQADIVKSLGDAEKELVALAEATPQEKYSWRPMEGVRSTGEVFMHVARGNFGYARVLGTPVPEGINPQEFDKITDKAKVVDMLKKSFAQIKLAVTNAGDLSKAVKGPGGRDWTVDALVLQAATHAHEHLGQSIAYARTNHIVPPWTAEREEQQRQAQPEKKP